MPEGRKAYLERKAKRMAQEIEKAKQPVPSQQGMSVKEQFMTAPIAAATNQLSKWYSWCLQQDLDILNDTKVVDSLKKFIPGGIDDVVIDKIKSISVWSTENLKNFFDWMTKHLDSHIQKKAERKEFRKKVIKTALSHNHPSWYTRFRSSKTVLNYDETVSKVLDLGEDINGTTPAVIRIPTQLVLPDSEATRLAQAFAANQTSLLNARGYGYADYSTKDIGNYIQNARYVIAMLAKAMRTFRSYNNYNIQNVLNPDVLIQASAPYYYTRARIAAERNELASIKERIRLLIMNIKTNIAGSLPLFDRTLYLFSNYFKDNKTKKNTVYMFDIDLSDSFGNFTYSYHDGNTRQYTGMGSIGNTDISTMLSYAEEMITNCFVNDPYSRQIRADINFLYGVTGSTHFTEYLESYWKDLSLPAEAKYDIGILRQIQNLTVNPPLKYNTSSNKDYAYVTNEEADYVSAIYEIGEVGPNNNDPSVSLGTITFKPEYKPVTAEKALDADELIVATRMKTIQDTSSRTFNFSIQIKQDGTISLRLSGGPTYPEMHKFENATSIQVMRYNPTFNGSNPEYIPQAIILPGNILIPLLFDYTNSGLNFYNRYLAVWFWTYSDWMSHAKDVAAILLAEDSESQVYAGQVMSYPATFLMHDLNQFAEITLSHMNTIDSVAILSEIIWSQNGDNLIDVKRAKQAKENKSSKDYKDK